MKGLKQPGNARMGDDVSHCFNTAKDLAHSTVQAKVLPRSVRRCRGCAMEAKIYDSMTRGPGTAGLFVWKLVLAS